MILSHNYFHKKNEHKLIKPRMKNYLHAITVGILYILVKGCL
jgi:hypothetical protein